MQFGITGLRRRFETIVPLIFAVMAAFLMILAYETTGTDILAGGALYIQPDLPKRLGVKDPISAATIASLFDLTCVITVRVILAVADRSIHVKPKLFVRNHPPTTSHP